MCVQLHATTAVETQNVNIAVLLRLQQLAQAGYAVYYGDPADCTQCLTHSVAYLRLLCCRGMLAMLLSCQEADRCGSCCRRADPEDLQSCTCFPH